MTFSPKDRIWVLKNLANSNVFPFSEPTSIMYLLSFSDEKNLIFKNSKDFVEILNPVNIKNKILIRDKQNYR